MNTTITHQMWSFKLCGYGWVSLVVVSLLFGLLAAVAVPVHAH